LEGGKEVLDIGRARQNKSKTTIKDKKEEKKVAVSGQKVSFVFPGQGAQEVGMTKDVQKLPAVKQLFETAKTCLGTI